jgi:hypothetical protein
MPRYFPRSPKSIFRAMRYMLISSRELQNPEIDTR